MEEPTVGEHLRTVDADYPDGVYRVVGTQERLALLRVTDGDRRVNTGELYHVPVEDLAGFETAEDPDAGLDPVGTFLEGLEGIWISLRELVRRLPGL